MNQRLSFNQNKKKSVQIKIFLSVKHVFLNIFNFLENFCTVQILMEERQNLQKFQQEEVEECMAQYHYHLIAHQVIYFIRFSFYSLQKIKRGLKKGFLIYLDACQFLKFLSVFHYLKIKKKIFIYLCSRFLHLFMFQFSKILKLLL